MCQLLVRDFTCWYPFSRFKHPYNLYVGYIYLLVGTYEYNKTKQRNGMRMSGTMHYSILQRRVWEGETEGPVCTYTSENWAELGSEKIRSVCTRKRQKNSGEWTRKKKSRAIVSMAIGRSVFRSKRKWGGGAGGLAEGARGSNIVRYFGRRRLNIWRIISALVIHLLPFHLVQVYIPSLSATYACWLH